MTTATLDRQSVYYALLCIDNGAQYDVYGDNWLELEAEARLLAASLGVEITVFNSEAPEY